MLGSLLGACSRRMSLTRQVTAWVLAIAGPALLTLAALPMHSTLVLGGYLFAMLLVVIAVAVIGGTRPALAGVLLGAGARELFSVPPFAEPGVDLRPNPVSLVGFVVAGTAVAIMIGELAATAIANAQAERELRELADTQAALRRLATLVAQGEPPESVFAATTREALRHFGTGTARMLRYELDGTVTLLANEGTTGPHVRVGERWEGYPPTGLTATVLATGQAARVDDYRDIPGGEPSLREGLRSAAAVPIHVNGRLWGAIAVGSGRPLPRDTEQRMTEFTDLVATAVANAQNGAELRASRARIVAAADEARRRIERDLHDGAQQHLLALVLRLRSAAVAPHESDEVPTEITDVAAGLTEVIDELREISRGIHPAILSSAGLRPALRALGRRSTVAVDMDVRIDGRLPEPVEVGAYYVVSEMLTNATKHARASVVGVDAEASGGTLRVCVHDDGVGGADPRRGTGLVGLKDRIEALGGTFSMHSPPGGGTRVCCELPVLAGGGPPDAEPVRSR